MRKNFIEENLILDRVVGVTFPHIFSRLANKCNFLKSVGTVEQHNLIAQTIKLFLKMHLLAKRLKL